MLQIVMASDLGHRVLTTRLVFVEKASEGANLDFHEGQKFVAQTFISATRTIKGMRRMMRRFVCHGRLPATCAN